MWPAYPKDLTDFRGARWLGTAVRTWKRWLWNMVDDVHFRDDQGEYFRVAEDRAIMIPMLEMCGSRRAVHIDVPLMVYNQSHSHPELETEATINVKLINSRKPYARISGLAKASSTPQHTAPARSPSLSGELQTQDSESAPDEPS